MIEIALFVVGLCFGSFVNALVWRLRKKRNFVSERSECTHCHHILAWYDLVPVVSWLSLRGRCRYCRKKIDDSPLVELFTAFLFVISYIFWPLGLTTVGVVLLILWLIALVILVALAVYDIKWMLLPDKLVFPLIGIGLAWFMIRAIGLENWSLDKMTIEFFLGLASVTGLYGLIFLINQSLVGDGDILLGIFMGLVLGWQLGLLAVVLANIFGFVVIAPGLARGKLKKNSRIPFGPFLIAATIVAFLFGSNLINWYLNTVIYG